MTETTNSLFPSAVALVGAVIAEFYAHLAPWLLLGAVLVLVDLRFGVMAAKVRGEEIRLSRMWRRTINKTIDYLCWVTVAEVCSRTFGITIGSPVVGMATLFVVYGIELNSCVNNYLQYKGINKRWNFFKLVERKGIVNGGDIMPFGESKEKETAETAEQ